DENALPEGRYPMTFTAAMDGLTATRATTDNTWKGSEEVAVQVGEVVKKYEVANNGDLSSTSPFYWQSTDINVSAWYLGTGYSATPPTSTSWSWAVQPHQSKTEPDNADDNYQRSDFLYAPAKSIAFNPQARADNSLTFYHQTAKVVINIVNAEAATNASAIQSVVIGHEKNLSLKGAYSIPTGNNTAGTWTPATGTDDMGTIIAKKLTVANKLADGKTTALASYAALVIPQDMEGKKFIAITLSDNNTYYYTPTQDGDADLQGGKQHTYDITVKHGYLEVGVSTSPQWSGGSEEVTGNAQTVTPGTDGNGSDWTQDGSSDETITGTEERQ
ncbi:fimbrillin family protein, partial [Bacteroides timonensis]|uniref:fimbrillin family protein n=1 Tax=Bacteroides timonensis TaxID=1470345 RepID=UPI0006940A9E